MNTLNKRLIILSVIMLVYRSAGAATLYMGSGETYTTLRAALSAMAGGDTLIIRDGTYTGTANSMDNSNYPPTGSAGTYTVIKAEHDGAAIFDGQGTTDMFTVNPGVIRNQYWKFEGLVWCRTPSSNVVLVNCNYVKFLRCGAYDVGPGNTANFFTRYGAYCLWEGCYAYGSGRYKFCGYQSNFLIFRNCVGRSDIIDTTGSPNPCAQFSMYSCSGTFCQNCIAIDSDQTTHYNANEYHGGFIVPSTDMDAHMTVFENCISLNIKTGGLCTTGNSYRNAYNTLYKNCVVWDCYPFSSGASVNVFRGYNDVLTHCTFGYSQMSGSQYNAAYVYAYNGTDQPSLHTTLKNSLFYHILGTDSAGISASDYIVLKDYGSAVSGVYDYNAFYGNTASNYWYSNPVPGNDAHSITSTNFIYSPANPAGALKYITRIESGSNLSSLADDGGDIGANIRTMIGVPGTVYGEPGYDTDTGVWLWPFPNENLMKTKMAAYSNGGVSGARGFCTGTAMNGAPQTLTRYIWEYLGNQIPSDIYSGDITPPARPSGFRVR